jgi:hypothetical protein
MPLNTARSSCVHYHFLKVFGPADIAIVLALIIFLNSLEFATPTVFSITCVDKEKNERIKDF